MSLRERGDLLEHRRKTLSLDRKNKPPENNSRRSSDSKALRSRR